MGFLFFLLFCHFFCCRVCSTETGVVTPWLPQIVCGWDWHARSSVARTDRSTGVTTAHRHATTSHVSTFGSDVTHPSPSRHFKWFHILFYFVRFCFVLIRLGCVGSSNPRPSCSLISLSEKIKRVNETKADYLERNSTLTVEDI